MTAAILTRHPGTRCKPTLRRRLLARLHARRQHRQVEAARDDAWVVRIAPHGTVPPLAEARARVASIKAATDAFNVPPAAVQPDRDVPGLEHLQRAWADSTGTFTAIAQDPPVLRAHESVSLTRAQLAGGLAAQQAKEWGP